MNLCIVSNNCYGIQYYKKRKMQYNTPFIGLFIKTEDYIKLLENFEYYMSLIPMPAIGSRKERYPVGLLGDDIELHFMHEKRIEEAIKKWERRKVRMSKRLDEYVFKMCDHGKDFSYDLGMRFCKVPYQNKILFLSKKNASKLMEYKENILILGTKNTPNGLILEKKYSVEDAIERVNLNRKQ